MNWIPQYEDIEIAGHYPQREFIGWKCSNCGYIVRISNLGTCPVCRAEEGKQLDDFDRSGEEWR